MSLHNKKATIYFMQKVERNEKKNAQQKLIQTLNIMTMPTSTTQENP